MRPGLHRVDVKSYSPAKIAGASPLTQPPNGGPGKSKGVLTMIVVKIFKDNAKKFANLITAVTFESCKKRLRLYFSDLEKVKERIISGEIIDLPYLTLQRDRRVNEEKRIRNERRRHLMQISKKKRKSQEKQVGHID
ncbi:hypothetical protein ES705_44952 [subsurface metagenome]